MKGKMQMLIGANTENHKYHQRRKTRIKVRITYLFLTKNEINDNLRELINESSNNEDSSGGEEEALKSFSKMIDTKEVVSAPIESKLAEIVNQLWQQPWKK